MDILAVSTPEAINAVLRVLLWFVGAGIAVYHRRLWGALGYGGMGANAALSVYSILTTNAALPSALVAVQTFSATPFVLCLVVGYWFICRDQQRLKRFEDFYLDVFGRSLGRKTRSE